MIKTQRWFLLIVITCIFAGVLSACNPISFPCLTVNRIVVLDHSAYAYVIEYRCGGSYGPGGETYPKDHYYVSEDGGKTWQEISYLPVKMLPAVGASWKIQKMVCVPNNQQICYRIMGKEQIEVSQNGGLTWRGDWNMPAGRKKFMAKILNFIVPDTIPYDLAILEDNGEHSVIVAMGNQGVMVKTPQGHWERYPVLAKQEGTDSATPQPYYSLDLGFLKSVLDVEFLLISIISSAFYIVISLYNWLLLEVHPYTRLRVRDRWVYLPFIVMSGIFLYYLINVLFLAEEPPLTEVVFFPEQLDFICWTPVSGLMFSWFFFVLSSRDRKNVFQIALVTFKWTVQFFASVVAPFFLWGMWVIPLYDTAQGLSWVLGLLVVFFAFRNAKQSAKQRGVSLVAQEEQAVG